MGKMVFKSPKRHRIIAIRDMLAENDIPVTNIKLHIHVEWSHGGISAGQAGIRISEARERRNELNVPIEEFTDKLNDAQTFELYVDEEHQQEAMELIDACDEETFFGDCVFSSESYDEAFEIYLLLNKNNIPCENVFPGVDEYLLFIDPEYMDKAAKVIERRNDKRGKRKPEDPFDQDYRRSSLFRFLPLF